MQSSISVGDVVIVNDLLGVVVKENENTIDVCDEAEHTYAVRRDKAVVVVTSFALAALLFVKLSDIVRSGKS